MVSLSRAMVVLGAAGLIAAAPAQSSEPPAKAGGPAALILNKSVQAELNLSAEQRARAEEAVRKVWDRHRQQETQQGPSAHDERSLSLVLLRAALANEILGALDGALKPEQFRRLRQIELQERGPDAFLDPAVQKVLELKREQIDRIKNIRQQAAADLRKAAEKPEGGKPAGQVEALHRETENRTLSVLTDEQKEAWALLTGAPLQKGLDAELKLSKEQKEKIRKAVAEVQAQHREEIGRWQLLLQRRWAGAVASEVDRALTEETLQALADLLKPEQMRRLRQIELRDRGAAFADPKLQKTLELTRPQQESLKALNEEAGRQARKIAEQGPDRATTKRKLAELKKSTVDRAVALLNPDQRDAWAVLAGTPLEPGQTLDQALDLSAEQSRKVKAAIEKVRAQHQEDLTALESFQEQQRRQARAALRNALAEDTWKSIADILQPEQLRRLRQIDWQQRGLAAFGDPPVLQTLRLTDAQKNKITQLRQEAAGELRKAHAQPGRGDSLRKQFKEKVLAVLTDEQQQAWKELIGKPFAFEPGAETSGTHGRPPAITPPLIGD